MELGSIPNEEPKKPWTPEYIIWKISSTDLNRLWFDAFPRIMGRIWKEQSERPKETPFGDAFTYDEYFRREQFKKLGIDVPEKMRIYFDAEPGEIDIIIGSGGIMLPNPPIPDEDRILNLYQIRMPGQVGWRLPGLKVDLCLSSRTVLELHEPDAGRSYKPDPLPPKLKVLSSAQWALQKSDAVEPVDVWTWRMFGNFYRDLLTNLPKIIAYAWENDPFYEALIRVNNERAALQEADIHIPKEVEIYIDRTRENDDCWISNLGVLLPFPPKPKEEEFFQAWIDGQAGIPTFTNSKT